MEEESTIKKYSKYSWILFLSSIIILFVAYLIAAFILFPIIGSIGGETILGYIFSIIIIYLPTGLFAYSIFISFYNYIKNNPNDQKLSFSYLLFILTIITTSLSIFSSWLFSRPPNQFIFVLELWYPIGFLIAITLSIISIIYIIKSKKSLIEWNQQLNFNLVMCMLYLITNIIVFSMFL